MSWPWQLCALALINSAISAGDHDVALAETGWQAAEANSKTDDLTGCRYPRLVFNCKGLSDEAPDLDMGRWVIDGPRGFSPHPTNGSVLPAGTGTSKAFKVKATNP